MTAAEQSWSSGLCFCEVSARAEDGTDIALALVTYQL
jgi:hypothetical protein